MLFQQRIPWAIKIINMENCFSKQMRFDEIRKIYLKKRREFHPDKLISKGLPEELIEKAKEKFIEIQEAYEELEKIHKK